MFILKHSIDLSGFVFFNQTTNQNEKTYYITNSRLYNLLFKHQHVFNTFVIRVSCHYKNNDVLLHIKNKQKQKQERSAYCPSQDQTIEHTLAFFIFIFLFLV